MTSPYRELVLTGPRSCVIERGLNRVNERSISVAVTYSGISLGTELSIYLGTNPRFRTPDAEVDGRVPTLRYPVRNVGYMEVGRIVSAPGEESRVGQLVALRCGHRTAAVQDDFDGLVPIPDDLPEICGIWARQLLPICANGLIYAASEVSGTPPAGGNPRLGDGVRARNVVVSGAGVIGLLLARWAVLLEAGGVVVIDDSEARLEVARQLGLEGLPSAQPWRELHKRWSHGVRDAGADVVLQCRGTGTALGTALRCLRPGGAVIDLAFYQNDVTGLFLGEDFHHLGLSIRAAQIGNRPRGLASAWPLGRLIEEGLMFLRSTHAEIAPVLLGEPRPLDQAPDLFAELASKRGGRTTQYVFRMDSA